MKRIQDTVPDNRITDINDLSSLLVKYMNYLIKYKPILLSNLTLVRDENEASIETKKEN